MAKRIILKIEPGCYTVEGFEYYPWAYPSQMLRWKWEQWHDEHTVEVSDNGTVDIDNLHIPDKEFYNFRGFSFGIYTARGKWKIVASGISDIGNGPKIVCELEQGKRSNSLVLFGLQRKE